MNTMTSGDAYTILNLSDVEKSGGGGYMGGGTLTVFYDI